MVEVMMPSSLDQQTARLSPGHQLVCSICANIADAVDIVAHHNARMLALASATPSRRAPVASGGCGIANSPVYLRHDLLGHEPHRPLGQLRVDPIHPGVHDFAKL